MEIHVSAAGILELQRSGALSKSHCPGDSSHWQWRPPVPRYTTCGLLMFAYSTLTFSQGVCLFSGG